MLSRAVHKHQRGRRWFTALATMSLITGLLVFSGTSLALTQSEFELDKNAINDQATVHLGSSKSAIKSTAATTSFIVCEFTDPVTGTPPYPTAFPFTIMVDAEVMTVTSYGATTTTTGGCGFSNPALVASGTRVYNVTRTARAAHPGGSDVTQLITNTVANTVDDWSDVFTQVNLDGNDIGPDDQCLALGAVECAWLHDGFGVSVFSASKDDEDISGWGHTDSSVPPSDEILDAFAAKYDDGTRELLVFGADRWSTNGAKDFGFWFFKNEVVAEPDGTFGDAVHAIGDILILGTFSQGGAIATIRVFSWVGTGGDTNTVLETQGDFGDCVPGGGIGPGCNTVNDTTIPSPWQYLGAGSTDVEGVIYSGGFLEGGIDLTALSLTGCFSSFMAETRSSPSISASLKDFVLGTFESCSASIATNVSDTSFEIGGSLTDDATVTVSGPAPTRNVDFYVCGPEDGIATCDATGTAVSSEDLAGAVVSGDDYRVTSDSFTPTSAGDYCFYAEYPADQDPNYPDGAFPIDSANECFTVTAKQPGILTVATSATADPLVTAIDDTATLSGTASQPDGDPAGGTITFTAYGPFDALEMCTGTAVYTSIIAVSGDGDYDASDGDANGNDIPGEVPGDQFIPTAAGTYNWIAVYSGDSPNTLGVSGLCTDDNEGSIIEPNQPTISTVATASGGVALGSVIDDTATIGNTANQPDGDPAGGTITFTAYGPFDALNVCTGTAVYTSVVAVSGDGSYTASDGVANNDGVPNEADDEFIPTVAGIYNWIAVYSGDLPNTLGVNGACADENESSLVISLQPSISTEQTFVLHDDATITVTSGAGGDLSGSVRFRLYNNATCDATVPADLLYDSKVNFASGIAVSGSGAFPQSDTVSSEDITITTSEPVLSWLVEFTSDNPAHKNVTSACNVENSSVAIDNG